MASTLTSFRAIISSTAGYSPQMAQLPCSLICCVTTACKGISATGARFPTRVTVAPLRTKSMADLTVSLIPTTSKATSAPRPPVRASTSSRISFFLELNPISAPNSLANFNFSSSRSMAIILPQPLALRTWITKRPITPHPTTTAVSFHSKGLSSTA